MEIGWRFIYTNTKPWNSNGVLGEEKEQLLCEVTNVTPHAVEYGVLKQISVIDPNPLRHSPTVSGGLSKSAIEASVSDGTLKWCA